MPTAKGYDTWTIVLNDAYKKLAVYDAKDTRNKWLCEQIAALRGAQTLAYLYDMSRIFRAVRLALYLARSLIPCIPKYMCALGQSQSARAH